MIRLRRSEDRRHVRQGDGEVWHSFFAQDRPSARSAGFGFLVAFDELLLSPGESSEPHPADEAELVTYIYKGALCQEDETWNSGDMLAGEFQRMFAGRRIRHQERNASRSRSAHVFRIALRPFRFGPSRAHEHKRFTSAQRHNQLCVVASPDGREGSLRIHQDVVVCSSILDAGHHLSHVLPSGRSAWLHVVHGEAALNDIVLTRGDGVGVADEPSVSLTVQEDTELLLIDLGLPPPDHQATKVTFEHIAGEIGKGPSDSRLEPSQPTQVPF